MKQIIPGIEDSYSTKILGVFQGMTRGAEIILFGSRAKGNYREGSDIDICIKNSGATLPYRDALLEKYESLNLPWKLDIVIYEFIEEPALKEHIDRVGIQLIKVV